MPDRGQGRLYRIGLRVAAPDPRAARCVPAPPRDVFNHRVRRLTELGPLDSLEVGYRLSPRGRAFPGGG
ncbi:hypothetical protein FHX45_005326 [Amycolatopsis granulosa]|nr:hypothetical protein [Amycolatopsis granulosa]